MNNAQPSLQVATKQDIDDVMAQIAEMKAMIGAKKTEKKSWLTVTEYAQYIGASVRTVNRRIACGQLETQKIAGKVMIRSPD